MEIVFELGDRRFGHVRRTEPRVRNRLQRAAAATFTTPLACVVETRQALELIADGLWRRTSQLPRPRSIGETLDLLRGSPSIPGSDWHLFKNLWSRASAIVHEGGATSEIALWIWLGTAQLSELVVDNS
jgi:hypothetical protein